MTAAKALRIPSPASFDMAQCDCPETDELNILGNGFFVVRDPLTREVFATRSGKFILDEQSYLATETGERVQGYTDPALSRIGDIQINAVKSPRRAKAGTVMLGHSIDETGIIFVRMSDGTSFVRGQILLQNFEDPRALVSEGAHLYSNLADAGPLPSLAPPCSNGLGCIHCGPLDISSGAGPWSN